MTDCTMEVKDVQHNYSQLNDVWMTEQLQILDFPPNLANDIQTLYFLSVHYFYGYFVSS